MDKEKFKKLIKYINSKIVNEEDITSCDYFTIISDLGFNRYETSLLRKLYSEDTTRMAREIFNLSEKKSLNFNEASVSRDKYKRFESYTKYIRRMVVKNYNLEVSQNIMGYDKYQNMKEMFQEGSLFLWEVILAMDESKTKNIDAFIYKSLTNKFINLNKKCNSDKNKSILTDFDE